MIATMGSSGWGFRGRAALAAVSTVAAGIAAGVIGAGPAPAIPTDVEPNLVTTLRCEIANPLPGPRVPVFVDVYNDVPFPSDGLPGPALTLVGSNRTTQGLLEFTTEARVSWRNLRTGRTGVVTVPSRARTITWEANLHTGRGPVAFTIRQKVGVMAFVPMVNAQYSTCSGRARV